MAHLKMSSVFLSPIQYLYILITAVLLVLPHAQSLYFNLSHFNSKSKDIYYEGDSAAIGGKILLTKYQGGSKSEHRVGRASYDTAIPLWNGRTRELANFNAHFSFRITKLGGNIEHSYGDGFAFFLAPFKSRLPHNSSGGCLGLVNDGDGNCTRTSNSSQIVAVEFDNYQNTWDPDGDHVGIDVDSIVSKADVTWEDGFQNNTVGNAWISYDPTAFNLSVFLTFDENPIFTGDSILSYHVDLRKFLPEKVRVGFSAATGRAYQICKIISWEFNSTLLDVQPTPAPEPAAQINPPTPEPAVQINPPAPSVSTPEPAVQINPPAPEPAMQINPPAPLASTPEPAAQINPHAPQPAVQINTPVPSASTGAPTKSMGVPTMSKNKVGLVGGIVAGITIASLIE